MKEYLKKDMVLKAGGISAVKLEMFTVVSKFITNFNLFVRSFLAQGSILGFFPFSNIHTADLHLLTILQFSRHTPFLSKPVRVFKLI